MKKIIALLLALSLALSLCACGQTQQSQPVEAAQEEVAQEEVPEMNGAPDGDPTWMLTVMENNMDQWLVEDTENTYTTYSVTDWDNNGLFEMTVSTYDYTAGEYSLAVYETQQPQTPLKEITVRDDVVYQEYDSMTCYYNDNDGPRYYAYGVPSSDDSEMFIEQVYVLYKAGDEMCTRFLGHMEGRYNSTTEQYDVSYYDADGSLREGQPESEIIPAILGTKLRCIAIRSSVRPEWFDNDIQTMLGATISSWYQELPSGPWFSVNMFTDPNSYDWQQLETPEYIESKLPDTGLDMPFRIIPSEDITVTLEVGEWTFLPLTFRGREAFTKELKAYHLYEFKAPVGDTLPLARLYATSGPGEYLFYDFAMDGSGEAPTEFLLTPGIPSMPSPYDSFMELCVAYAGIAAKYEDHYGIIGEHMWDAIANGVTRYAMVWSDPDSEGNIYVDEADMERFTNIMSPFMFLNEPESSNVTHKDGQYVVKATFDDILRDAYVDGSSLAPDGSNGKVVVVLPAMGNMDVEVTFELANDWQDHVDNPWIITGAIYGYG